MKKILQINSSPRGEASFSNRLSQAIVNKIIAKEPGSTLKTIDLVHENYPHIDAGHITAFFTPVDQHTEKDRAAIRYSEQAIGNIMEADVLVIGVNMINFFIPSNLKAWLDHIVRAGITFRYTENGPEGLIKGKKVYVALASGGVYSEGPMKPHDYIEPYLRFLLGFIGLTDVSFIRAEGTKVPALQETVLEKAIAAIPA